MKRLAQTIVITLVGVSVWAAGPPSALTIDEAIRAAMTEPSAEDWNVVVAEGRVRFLEAMGRRRVELSPQLGLLAMANPFAALTNVGAGLLAKQGAVPPILIADARADLLLAQAARKRRAFYREMESTNRFYELAEGQRLSEAACATFDDVSERRRRFEQELSAARITQAELIRYDLDATYRESECLDAENRRRVAARRLATSTGGREDTIRAAVDIQKLRVADTSLRDLGQLVQVAMTHRTEPVTSRDAVARLRAEVNALKPASTLRLAVGGSHNLSGPAFSAGKAYVLAKLAKVDREMEELTKEVRERVAEMKIRFEGQRSHLVIAKKRLALLRQQTQAASVRHRAGLETVAAHDAAESAERQSAAAYQRLDGESRLTLAALISVCGIRSETPERQLALLSEPPIVVTASAK